MSQAGHHWCPMYINLTFFYDLDLYRHILAYNYYIVFLKGKKKIDSSIWPENRLLKVIPEFYII